MNKKELLDKIYTELAESLNITDTMTVEIINSYEAVGKYLGNLEEELDIQIYPQGSMGLGTLVRPISSDEEGDYDVDLVCLLKNGSYLSAKDIKQIVGKRLSEGERYKSRLDEEGKRCWTLKYPDFHMDILPSVPQLNQSTIFDRKNTEIRLTNKEEEGVYSDKISNPKAYREWFIEQMEVTFLKRREIVAKKRNVEIEKVKLFDVRTPLQMAIQILKRHRDIMFSGKENKPISIIITTLAAKAYTGQTDLYDTIETILQNMHKYIEKDSSGKILIFNPTVSSENFADKWEESPEKERAFFDWVRSAQTDILQNPMEFAGGFGSMKNQLREIFGSRAVNQAFEVYEKKNLNDKNIENLGVNSIGNLVNNTAENAVAPLKKHTFYGH
ncbi:nucleotidyltransferase domain-containing protein [Lactococcus lactis]|uniref:nucleotidyltransferase domain-containing protein n=1 Tax=Lactococcus lactis TaxID=1358 RepID=UPI003D0F7C2A